METIFLQRKSLLKLHTVEVVSTYSYFQRLTEKLLDYIVTKNLQVPFPDSTSTSNFESLDVLVLMLNNTTVETTRIHAQRKIGVY